MPKDWLVDQHTNAIAEISSIYDTIIAHVPKSNREMEQQMQKAWKKVTGKTIPNLFPEEGIQVQQELDSLRTKVAKVLGRAKHEMRFKIAKPLQRALAEQLQEICDRLHAQFDLPEELPEEAAPPPPPEYVATVEAESTEEPEEEGVPETVEVVITPLTFETALDQWEVPEGQERITYIVNALQNFAVRCFQDFLVVIREEDDEFDFNKVLKKGQVQYMRELIDEYCTNIKRSMDALETVSDHQKLLGGIITMSLEYQEYSIESPTWKEVLFRSFRTWVVEAMQQEMFRLQAMEDSETTMACEHTAEWLVEQQSEGVQQMDSAAILSVVQQEKQEIGGEEFPWMDKEKKLLEDKTASLRKRKRNRKRFEKNPGAILADICNTINGTIHGGAAFRSKKYIQDKVAEMLEARSVDAQEAAVVEIAEPPVITPPEDHQEEEQEVKEEEQEVKEVVEERRVGSETIEDRDLRTFRKMQAGYRSDAEQILAVLDQDSEEFAELHKRIQVAEDAQREHQQAVVQCNAALSSSEHTIEDQPLLDAVRLDLRSMGVSARNASDPNDRGYADTFLSQKKMDDDALKCLEQRLIACRNALQFNDTKVREKDQELQQCIADAKSLADDLRIREGSGAKLMRRLQNYHRRYDVDPADLIGSSDVYHKLKTVVGSAIGSTNASYVKQLDAQRSKENRRRLDVKGLLPLVEKALLLVEQAKEHRKRPAIIAIGKKAPTTSNNPDVVSTYAPSDEKGSPEVFELTQLQHDLIMVLTTVPSEATSKADARNRVGGKVTTKLRSYLAAFHNEKTPVVSPTEIGDAIKDLCEDYQPKRGEPEKPKKEARAAAKQLFIRFGRKYMVSHRGFDYLQAFRETASEEQIVELEAAKTRLRALQIEEREQYAAALAERKK